MLFRVHMVIPTWHEDAWHSRDFDSTNWLEEGALVCKLYAIDFDEGLPSFADVYLTQYGLCVISQMVIGSYAEPIEIL